MDPDSLPVSRSWGNKARLNMSVRRGLNFRSRNDIWTPSTPRISLANLRGIPKTSTQGIKSGMFIYNRRSAGASSGGGVV